MSTIPQHASLPIVTVDCSRPVWFIFSSSEWVLPWPCTARSVRWRPALPDLVPGVFEEHRWFKNTLCVMKVARYGWWMTAVIVSPCCTFGVCALVYVPAHPAPDWGMAKVAESCHWSLVSVCFRVKGRSALWPSWAVSNPNAAWKGDGSFRFVCRRVAHLPLWVDVKLFLNYNHEKLRRKVLLRINALFLFFRWRWLSRAYTLWTVRHVLLFNESFTKTNSFKVSPLLEHLCWRYWYSPW